MIQTCAMLAHVAEAGIRARFTAAVTVALAVVAVTTSGCASGPGPEPEGPEQGEVPAIARLVPPAIAADGVLVVGTDPSYPPMEFMDREGLAGADIDLANAVAEVLGLSVRFEKEAFTALVDGVRTDRIEMAVSALTLDKGESARADAVVYFNSADQVVASRSDPGLRPGNMCGRTVAALEGSTQVRTLSGISRQCREAGSPPIVIEALSDQDQVTRAVLTDRVSGMLTDIPVATHVVAQNPRRLRLSGRPFDRAPFGMLTPPQAPDMARAVEGAVQQLIDDGRYERILRKWNVARGGVERASIRWARPTRQP